MVLYNEFYVKHNITSSDTSIYVIVIPVPVCINEYPKILEWMVNNLLKNPIFTSIFIGMYHLFSACSIVHLIMLH